MNKNIFKTLAVCFAFTALVLTGCKNDFDGTTVNYKQEKEEFTGNYGENKKAEGLSKWHFSFSPSSGLTAADDLEIEVYFSSSYELDYDSVEKAFTFYKLKNNTVSKYYPLHDGEIPKTLIHITEPFKYSGTVRFLYRLDAKDVTTNRIAFAVDATKLKYKNGLAVVSNDGNLKAGEETDSFVRYLSVSEKEDGTTTTPLSYSFDEEYLSINYNRTDFVSNNPVSLATSDTDLTPSGKYRFAIRAPVKTRDADGAESTYDEDIGENLSKKFKLQIQKPESTKWEDGGKLKFDYHSKLSSATEHPSDPYSAFTYTTDVDTSVMAPGTKWRIVCDKSVKLGSPAAWETEAYGHVPYEYYPKVISKIYPASGEYSFIPYGDKETSLLFAYGRGSTPGTFEKDDCVEMSAFFTQNRFVNWISIDQNQVEVQIKYWEVELDKTDGFILVDSKNTIIPTTTTVHKNADGIIDRVFIKPVNSQLNLWQDSYNVYVNSGTTIKSNPEYPKQLCFGCYPDLSKGVLSGYIKLVQGLIQPGESYSDADAWNGEYENGWVNENDYSHYEDGNWNNHFNYQRRIYLIEGKSYTIQMVNGYASNPNKDNFLAMLSNNNRGEELCYYGDLYLYKEGENTGSSSNYEYHMGYSRGSDLTFTCEETGYYYICINRDSYASLTSPHYSYSNYQPRYTEYDSSIENYIINRDWYYDAYCNIDRSDITGDQTFENPYYNSENEDSPSEVTVTGPVLFNFTPDWDGTEDGAYTGTTIESHAEDTNGNWLLNQNKKIPYRWGNVYYHMFLSTN